MTEEILEPVFCQCKYCLTIQQADEDGGMYECNNCNEFAWILLGTKEFAQRFIGTSN